MKLQIDYCDLCKKKPSCKLIKKLHKPGGYSLDDLDNIYKCTAKKMDAVRSILNHREPLSTIPMVERNSIIAFLYTAQDPDRVETALQYTDDIRLCFKLVQWASLRLVELTGCSYDWTLRDRAMSYIGQVYEFWERKHRKGGAK